MRSPLLSLTFKLVPHLVLHKCCWCSSLTGIPSLLPGPAPSYIYLLTILKMYQVLTVTSTLMLYPPLGTLSCLGPV